MRKIRPSAKLRVVIDGVALQTTAGALETGAISTCLRAAWQAFLSEYAERGGNMTSRMAGFTDSVLHRTVTIQIDLYDSPATVRRRERAEHDAECRSEAIWQARMAGDMDS